MQIRSLVHGPNGRVGDRKGGVGQERQAKAGVRTEGAFKDIHNISL